MRDDTPLEEMFPKAHRLALALARSTRPDAKERDMTIVLRLVGFSWRAQTWVPPLGREGWLHLGQGDTPVAAMRDLIAVIEQACLDVAAATSEVFQ